MWKVGLYVSGMLKYIIIVQHSFGVYRNEAGRAEVWDEIRTMDSPRQGMEKSCGLVFIL